MEMNLLNLFFIDICLKYLVQEKKEHTHMSRNETEDFLSLY